MHGREIYIYIDICFTVKSDVNHHPENVKETRKDDGTQRKKEKNLNAFDSDVVKAMPLHFLATSTHPPSISWVDGMMVLAK